MRTRQNLTAEVLQSAHSVGRSYALARIISNVFHPMILSTISFLIVGLFATSAWAFGLAWALFGVALQIIPVAIFYTIRLRQGAYSDEDVSIRQQRNELYLFSVLNLFIGIAVLLALRAPMPFLALLSSAALLAVSAWVINLSWKISVHASSAASCAAVAFIYDNPLGMLLGISALLVGWARIHTGNHTPLQVMAGFGLATLCVWGMFRVFGLI
jgi:membrane-associated phospholipid phosphatase